MSLLLVAQRTVMRIIPNTPLQPQRCTVNILLRARALASPLFLNLAHPPAPARVTSCPAMSWPTSGPGLVKTFTAQFSGAEASWDFFSLSPSLSVVLICLGAPCLSAASFILLYPKQVWPPCEPRLCAEMGSFHQIRNSFCTVAALSVSLSNNKKKKKTNRMKPDYVHCIWRILTEDLHGEI